MQWYIRPKQLAARQVLAFQARYPDLSSAAIELVIRLAAVAETLAALFAERGRLQRELQEAMEERTRVERVIRGLVGQLALMFRVLAKSEGVVPPAPVAVRDRGAPAFMRGVAAAISAAELHRDRLLHYGLPPRLIRELTDRLDEYEAHEEERQRCLAAMIPSSVLLEEAGAEAAGIIFHLDALNRIRFAADPARLAEWRAARSVSSASAQLKHRPVDGAGLDTPPVPKQ
jgi:hypothetical protein